MGILREVDGTGLASGGASSLAGRSQCLDFKSYRRLLEALMSYIREKLSLCFSTAFLLYFSIWKSFSCIEKFLRTAAFFDFTMRNRQPSSRKVPALGLRA
jgi:hypothetical protein